MLHHSAPPPNPALTLLHSALGSPARRCPSLPVTFCLLWTQLLGPMATHSHLSQPLCWFCPSPPLSLGFRIPTPSPDREHPPSWLLGNPASLWTAGRPWEWPPALTAPPGLRFGKGGQEQRGTTGLPGWMGGLSPPSVPLPATIFPSFLHFLHLPLPLLFTLPEYAQAVIMGPESSHIYTQPAPASLPPASHRAGPMEPPAALG